MRRLKNLIAMLLVFPAVASILACRERPPRFFYDFESEADLYALPWKCGVIFSLSESHATSGKKCLQLELFPASSGSENHYPGVGFRGFDPDWSPYRTMVFDAYNPEAAPLHLCLRIDDRKNPPYPDRLNTHFIIRPGRNRISLPLAGLETSGNGRKLQINRINAVDLFLASPKKKHTLYIDRVRLE